MAKELMEIGGFITEGAEIVNHDNSLSGNGTVDSPLGLNENTLHIKTEEVVVNVTGTKTSGWGNWACCQLSANIPEGYRFGCWCNIATQGWGGACYAEFPLNAVTNCWNPGRAENITTAAKIRASYILLPANS
jgi:hypothetical protein